MKLLLQLEGTGHWSEDTAVAARIADEQNWLHCSHEYDILSAPINDITQEICKGRIPVGSVEFVNKVLKVAYGRAPMHPTNIPDCLNRTMFCQRRIDTAYSKDRIEDLFGIWKVDKLFIKSASVLKGNYTDIYQSADRLPEDSAYFVSETIDLKSEWRVFVNHNKVIDVKNYSGDPWCLPSKGLVNEMVTEMNDKLTSYTLDVGVLETGETVIVEVHNFISCGLYGFDRPVLLQMLYNGFAKELF